MDFAALKQSSISFFNSEENETAVSRWARSRTRAAKVFFGVPHTYMCVCIYTVTHIYESDC